MESTSEYDSSGEDWSSTEASMDDESSGGGACTSSYSYESEAASFCEYIENYDAIVASNGHGVACHQCEKLGATLFESVTFRAFCHDGCLDGYIELYGLTAKSGGGSGSKGGKKKKKKSRDSRSKKKKSGASSKPKGKSMKSSGKGTKQEKSRGGSKGKKQQKSGKSSGNTLSKARKATRSGGKVVRTTKGNLGLLKDKLKQRNRDKNHDDDNQHTGIVLSM